MSVRDGLIGFRAKDVGLQVAVGFEVSVSTGPVLWIPYSRVCPNPYTLLHLGFVGWASYAVSTRLECRPRYLPKLLWFRQAWPE